MLCGLYFSHDCAGGELATPRAVTQDVSVQATVQSCNQHIETTRTQDRDVQATAKSRDQRTEARPNTRDFAMNATVATTNNDMLTDVSDTTGKKTCAVQTDLSTLSMTSVEVQQGASGGGLGVVNAQTTTSLASHVDAHLTYDLTDFAEENDSKIQSDLRVN